MVCSNRSNENANLNGGLVYIMGSAYNTSIGTLHSIATARLGSIGFIVKRIMQTNNHH